MRSGRAERHSDSAGRLASRHPGARPRLTMAPRKRYSFSQTISQGDAAMERSPIALENFRFDQSIIAKRWMLLTAGAFSPGAFNSMTISWGSVGQLWNKTFFQVVVRPTRYTRTFLEAGDTFTLCVFPESCKKALSLLGAKSGRDGDKIAESGLTPIPQVDPRGGARLSFDEAELIVECRKMYWQDYKSSIPSISSRSAKSRYHGRS